MRRFIAALIGAGTILCAAACAPVDDGEAPSVANGAGTGAVTTPVPDPSIAVPRLLMDERFTRAWPDNPASTAWFTPGGYRLYARSLGQFVAVRAPLSEVPQDVILTATFRKVGGPSGGGYGLIVGDQHMGAGDGLDQWGQYVVAAVGDRGEVGVWRRNGESWLDLIPWTPSVAVRGDSGENELTVRLLADRLTFAVNGGEVADIPVGLHLGGVGIFAGGDLNEVLVDHFRVLAPGRPDDPTLSTSRNLSQPQATQSRPQVAAEQPRPISLPRVEPALTGGRRVLDLLTSIAEDIGSILNAFSSGGIDGAHSPVNDPRALDEAAAKLESASRKAAELVGELDNIQRGITGGDH